MISSTMKFTLPEHLSYVQTLGYACGLSDGIFSGMLPVVAKGPTATNDPGRFNEVFNEWHDLGFTFGSRAKRKLVQVFDSLPQQWWWPICIAFASERAGTEQDSELMDLSPYVQQGLQAFQTIYRNYVL